MVSLHSGHDTVDYMAISLLLWIKNSHNGIHNFMYANFSMKFNSDLYGISIARKHSAQTFLYGPLTN